MSAGERVVTLPGGLDIGYAEQGAADGVPVVFVHGYADSWRSFEPVLERLPASVHAFALSLRGHGTSSKPATGYRVGQLAADVGAFMDALGIPAAALVGGSSGALVVRRFALEQPGRARGMVLLGSPFSLRDHPGARQLFDETVSRVDDPVPIEFIRTFQQGTFAKPVPKAFVERVIGESARVPAHVWKAALAALLDDDTAELAEGIALPCLVIWGDQDIIVTRAEQERLVASIPGTELVVYEGSGHSLYWEEPERVAADIVRFIDGLRAAE